MEGYKLPIMVRRILKKILVSLMWSFIAASIITPRIYLRIEYSLTHSGTEPYMLPILDWPQYMVLCFASFLMGFLIGDFAVFLVMYLLGVILSCIMMYVLVCLPVYLNILTSEYFLYYGFSQVALNYVAKSWIIAPFIIFLFVGVFGVFCREFS